MRLLTCFLALCLAVTFAFADQETQFSGLVNSDQTNIRIDSTVASATICKINRGEKVEVVKESFGWYKIRLPLNSPAYIKKSFTILLPADKNPQARTAKVEKENVNIRLGPGQDSSVIGKANKDEVVSIVSETPQWYQIQPTQTCFGWINKQFADKTYVAETKTAPQQPENPAPPAIQENITVEGIIAPYGKVFGRKATHKLITKDNKTYLLKGNKKSLDDLNYQKVRASGVVISLGNNPVIEVKKLEIAQ